jgi:hypothetical protein
MSPQLSSNNYYKGINVFFFNSVACLAALQRHGECLALINKRLNVENDNADLLIMRARLHQLFRNVRNILHSITSKLLFLEVNQGALFSCCS